MLKALGLIPSIGRKKKILQILAKIVQNRPLLITFLNSSDYDILKINMIVKTKKI